MDKVFGTGATGNHLSHSSSVSINANIDSIPLPEKFSRRGISCFTGES